MGKIIIKVGDKHYPKESDVRNLITYIAGQGKNANKEKVYGVKGFGISNEWKAAAEQILKTQRRCKMRGKRRAYHFIISFPKAFDDRNTVALIANAVGDMLFQDEGHQVYCAVHTSTEHLHIHFGMSALNFRTRKKWRKTRDEYGKFKKEIEGVVRAVVESYDPRLL